MRALLLMTSVSLLAYGCAGSRAEEEESSSEQAVIGGRPETAFPGVGYLLRDGRPACSASLVEPDLVLTAAHCVDAAHREIAFGWGDIGAKTSVRTVARAVHPRYVEPPRNGGVDFEGFDVALLRLERPAGVQPVAVGSSLGVRRVLAVGYGATDYAPGPDGQLEARNVGTEKKSAEGIVLTVNPTELFVRFAEGASTCYGDSGSPLFAEDGRAIGVLSRFTGATRCRPEDRTLMAYTRVDAIDDFRRHARECLGGPALDVASCLRQDQRHLCRAPRVTSLRLPEAVVVTHGDLRDGGTSFILPEVEERALRLTVEVDATLSLFAQGDARMSVAPVGYAALVTDRASQATLEGGVLYEVVVRSCNGQKQTVTLRWQPTGGGREGPRHAAPSHAPAGGRSSPA